MMIGVFPKVVPTSSARKIPIDACISPDSLRAHHSEKLPYDAVGF